MKWKEQRDEVLESVSDDAEGSPLVTVKEGGSGMMCARGGTHCAASGEVGQDRPGMLVRPPVILILAILIGLGLQRLWPLRFVPHGLETLVGPTLVGLCLILFALCVRNFRKVRTGIRAGDPTTVIVTSGPYQWSRNPIYLAFILFLAGLAVWLDNAWLLVLEIPFIRLLRYAVIAKEEAYLERKFGEEYRAYKSSVRRWL